MLDAIGGRKFLMALIVIAVGTAVQILSPHGVSTEYAALLIGVAGGFGATNAFITSQAMKQEAAPATGATEHEAEAIADFAKVATEQIQAIKETQQAHATSIEQAQASALKAGELAKAALAVRTT